MSVYELWWSTSGDGGIVGFENLESDGVVNLMYEVRKRQCSYLYFGSI